MKHAVLGLVVALAACRTGTPSTAGTHYADIRASSGAAIGRVNIAMDDGAIRITGDLAGLPPGDHGLHFHQVGRCDAPDFTTAGGHFNPGNMQHGLESPTGPHAGDWPNLIVTTAGSARLNLTTNRMTLDANPASGVLDADGAAIVIHAAPDDQRTDPSGNSGARIACGVITRR